MSRDLSCQEVFLLREEACDVEIRKVRVVDRCRALVFFIFVDALEGHASLKSFEVREYSSAYCVCSSSSIMVVT